MTQLSAASLRDRVTLQTIVTVADGSGGSVQSWATLAIVWAMVVAAGNSQPLDGEQQTTVHRYNVTIRNRSDLTAGMRILWRGQVLKVISLPIPQSLSAFRILSCTTERGIA